MDPNKTIQNVLRLAKLDTSVFDEVKDDQQELVSALVVAAVSILLTGLGTWLYWQMNWGDYDVSDDGFLNGFLLGSIFFIAMYAVWVLVSFVVLSQFAKATVDIQSLFRTMGYAAVPFALGLLMFIPLLYPVFAIVPLALVMLMSIYATRAVTDADANKVLIANIAGLTVFVLVLSVIALSGDFFEADTPMGAGIFGILLDIP